MGRSTTSNVEPWYRATVEVDRVRFAEMAAQIDGHEYAPDDPSYPVFVAFVRGAWHDPDILRAFFDVGGLNSTVDEVMARPGLFEQVLAQADAEWPWDLPNREELVALVR